MALPTLIAELLNGGIEIERGDCSLVGAEKLRETAAMY